MPQRKKLQHTHAVVALTFPSSDRRDRFVGALVAQASVQLFAREDFEHQNSPASVLHLRYQARGANMNDINRRLKSAAKSSGVDWTSIHAPRGFSVWRPDLEESAPDQND